MKKKMLKLNVENLEFEEIIVETEGKDIDFEEIQKAIGGYFERVTYNLRLQRNKINVFVDEEGKLKDLKPSVAVCFKKSNKIEIIELLAGSLVFTRCDGEYDYGLTDEQIKIIKEELQYKAIVKSGIMKDGKEQEIEETVRVLKYM